MIIRIDYPQPAVRLDLWGGTGGTFAGLDRFNRVVDQRWQNNTSGTPADIDRYQYGYDRDSNRQYKANVVGTPAVAGGLDEYYAYDRVNRLNEMQRGTLNGTRTGISGTPSREMDWTLDPTGNWPGYLTRTAGTTDLNQSRTSNKVNEITAISESTGPSWVTPAYDAAGNTTTMPEVANPASSFSAVYDAWNRMTSISASGTQVAKYQYDGRNRRIVKETYTGGTLSETRHFYFRKGWRVVEERVGTSTSMDKQYVWGVRYVDELVCRDDATPRRLYASQDANFNVTAVTDIGGTPQERYVYDPYGYCSIFTGSWGGAAASAFHWQIGYQGLLDDEDTKLICARTRYLHPLLGIWLAADPISYIDGPNLYLPYRANPTNFTDSFGLCTPGQKSGGTCEMHVSDYSSNPSLDEAKDELSKAAGGVEQLDTIMGAIDYGSVAGATDPIEALGEAIKTAAEHKLDWPEPKAEELAKKAKDLSTKVRGNFGGYNLYTRINYKLCVCHRTWYTLFIGTTTDWENESTPWQEYKQGGVDGMGLFESTLDGYSASATACQDALAQWNAGN